MYPYHHEKKMRKGEPKQGSTVKKTHAFCQERRCSRRAPMRGSARARRRQLARARGPRPVKRQAQRRHRAPHGHTVSQWSTAALFCRAAMVFAAAAGDARPMARNAGHDSSAHHVARACILGRGSATKCFYIHLMHTFAQCPVELVQTTIYRQS